MLTPAQVKQKGIAKKRAVRKFKAYLALKTLEEYGIEVEELPAVLQKYIRLPTQNVPYLLKPYRGKQAY